MFNKLRNKFLILGMTITSLVLITAFTVTYMVTYDSITRENTAKLNEVISNPFIPVIPNITDMTDINEKIKESLLQFMLPTDYKPSFTLLLDKNGELVEKSSFIDMSEEDYNEAAQKAWRHQDSSAPIRVGGRLWQYAGSGKGYYIIKTFQKTESENSETDINNNIEVYQFTFLDVTESHQTLQNLLLTFLIVGIATLIIVFSTSLYFANNAIKPIKTAWEAQKQFVADASHELKTPITIINSNYGVLLSKKNETIESQMKWINYIKDGADRMDKLIGELLYLAKTESTQAETAVIPVNISEIVCNEIYSMEVAAVDKELIIKKDIEPKLIINSDGEKLAQVVRILLENAIKYTNQNGSIDILLKQEKHHIVFMVKNTGDGIAKEHITKIFDRFYRVDSSRAHNGGYGLGLSIAKAIIDSMGGKIYALSDEGKSATFVVTLTKI